ncbi:MAG: DUF1292 domain-containing protein [Firmicutes bacterium]|nr:DUF1292 domain-containing protein [Bacillota bacterium]
MATQDDQELEAGFEDDEIIILEDEDGNEHEFIIADTFDVESRMYAVLVAADGSSEEGFIFRVEEKEEDGESFVDFAEIDNDEEWAQVEKVYNALVAQEDEEDAE